jgi:hypothetical protein
MDFQRPAADAALRRAEQVSLNEPLKDPPTAFALPNEHFKVVWFGVGRFGLVRGQLSAQFVQPLFCVYKLL